MAIAMPGKIAAQGYLGGLFCVLEANHGIGKLSQLPQRGACIRVAKEAGCKPVWSQAHAQVRVLPLPRKKTRRQDMSAVDAQRVGHRPFKPA